MPMDRTLEIFRRADTNGKGKIRAAVLRDVLGRVGMTKEVVDELIRAAEKDVDGQMDYVKFLAWLDVANVVAGAVAPSKEPADKSDKLALVSECEAASLLLKQDITLLSRIALLKSLPVAQVALACTRVSVDPGQMFCQEFGDGASSFFVLRRGTAVVDMDADSQLSISIGDCFGPRAAKSQPRWILDGETVQCGLVRERSGFLSGDAHATLRASGSEGAECLVCDRKVLEDLGLSERFWLSRTEVGEEELVESGDGKVPFAKHETWHVTDNGLKRGLSFKPVGNVGPRIPAGGITTLGLIGCGCFSSMELVRHESTMEVYAMKTLGKGFVVKHSMQDKVFREKQVLGLCDSPFICKLHGTRRDAQTLRFYLEPLLGGELYSLYKQKGLHGSHAHAIYYAASTALGLDHLHKRHIVCRGVRTEDLVLDSCGHLKIVDLGLAKIVFKLTFTTCGTPEYLAPEMIQHAGYNRAVDWWTLGVLLFELMAGHAPFEAPSPMETFTKVVRGIGEVQFPPECKGAVEDVIKGCLASAPDDRLCMKPGGFLNFEKASVYESFDWTALRSGTMHPPYIPTVASPIDMSNFTASGENLPRTVQYTDDGTNWDADF